MKRFVTGAVLLAGLALAGPAMAEPGQCSMTDYGSFECDVTADGGGVSFALPDGQVFVFVHVAEGAGPAFLISEPGRVPHALGDFAPVEGEPGCWHNEADTRKFCAAILQ